MQGCWLATSTQPIEYDAIYVLVVMSTGYCGPRAEVVANDVWLRALVFCTLDYTD